MSSHLKTMEFIYQKDADWVATLQHRLVGYSDVACSMSNVFDPRYAYLVFSPLMFSLSRRDGIRLMWTAVMVEWTNHVLKWLVQGERPYWWVHETDVYNRTGIQVPDIRQFPLTCETGPGCPSGHSQMIAAVWFGIFQFFLRKNNPIPTNGWKCRRIIPCLFWSVYLFMLVATGASRVFLAAHFPHQCLFGVILGILLSLSLRNIGNKLLSVKFYCCTTAGMAASIVTLNLYLNAIGSDPSWTLDRAVRWCVKSEYVHISTTPFFTMARYCGYLFGMGFGVNCCRTGQNQTRSAMAVCACLSIAVCLFLEPVALTKVTDNIELFYIQSFAVYACLSYATTTVVPKCLEVAWGKKIKEC